MATDPNRFIRNFDPPADTHEIVGNRRAFINPMLPSRFPEDDGETDFDASLNDESNAQMGTAAAFDRFVEGMAKAAADSELQKLLPKFRDERLALARKGLEVDAIKTIERCEARAASAEKEATAIQGSLLGVDKVNEHEASVVLRAFQELPKDSRHVRIHDIAKMITAGKEDPQTLRDGRAFLAAILKANKFAGLIDDVTRAFVTQVLSRTADPAKYSRMRHLILAARSIRENASRARHELQNYKG